MLARFGTLLLVSLLSLSLVAQSDAKPLPSKAKDELKATLQNYIRAKSDADKQKFEFQLFSWGRAGVDYLETLRSQKELADALAVVLADAPERLGYDLLKEKVTPTDSYDPSYFVHDEIVLFKRGDQFGGFAVDSKTSQAIDGKIKVKYWSQKADEVKKLSQPGGKFGDLEVTGQKTSKKMRANSAYDEFDFDFTVEGTKLRIHFSGPAAFRVHYDAGTSVSLSGVTKPDALSSGDKAIVYRDTYSPSLAKAAALLQKYMFRSVPGCEPLMTDDSNKADFAQYEQVQIHVREARLTREPVVVVWFLEPERVSVAPHHRKFIYNFLNEILPVKDENIVILGGMSPSMEGNKAWNDAAWVALPQKIVKLLRANMPENQ